MIRKHKKYSRPRKAYDIVRIEEENKLVEKYGLKNKREIWKASARIDEIRNQAKLLITSSPEKQRELVEKLNKIGLNVSKLADILALKKEDWLKRRLQSVIVEKHLVSKPKAARQLIVHKHVSISGNIVNIPGYIVPVSEEENIQITGMKTKEMRHAEKAVKGEKKNG